MNIVRKTVLSEGPHRIILHFYLESDGVEGELDNYLLVDPQVDFNPRFPIGPTQRVTLMKLWSSCAVFDTVIKFNALELVPTWVIVPDADSHISFEYFGGLKDRSGAEHDGKILISTNGFAPLGSVGAIVLELKKN